jgi:hypothetical protein
VSEHSIGGTDLATYCAGQVAEYGIADNAVQDRMIPNMSGLVPAAGTLKGRDYTLLLTVVGKEAGGVSPGYSRARYLYNVQQLAALILNPDSNGAPQPFTLTRTLTLPSGTQTCTISARYRDGFRMQDTAAWAGRVAPVLQLLDAWWLDGSSNKVYA